jgi:HD-like signal output (HDOD) protein
VELSAEARALEERLISYFDGHNLVLPPLPRVAENVLKRLRSAQCSMTDVAHDLSEDPVSTATVLRMANSALYRGVEKITSLQTAVTRLGANAIRTLMMHQSLRAAVFAHHADARALAELIWRGSLAAGTIMRELAPFLHRDEEEAFTIGLLHDIGNVVTLRLVLEHERSTHVNIDTDTFDYLCYETHQEFGELIANAWQLPPDLKSLISDHHIYPGSDDPLRRDRLAVLLTDMICQMLGYAPLAQYDLLNATVVADLGLAGRPEFTELLAALPDRIASVADEFS